VAITVKPFDACVPHFITKQLWRSLRLVGGFRGQVIEWRQTNSTTTDPRCHGNKIWPQNGYYLACITDISEIFGSNGVVTVRLKLSKDVSQILGRLTLAVMATKCETKRL